MYTQAFCYDVALSYLSKGMIAFCMPFEGGVKVVGGYVSKSHVPYVLNREEGVRAAYLLSAGTALVKEFNRQSRAD